MTTADFIRVLSGFLVAACATTVLSGAAMAQEEEEVIEEIMVTDQFRRLALRFFPGRWFSDLAAG